MNTPPDLPKLVRCPRCHEMVVTVEMRTPLSVFWRCVRCGHMFAQRRSPAAEHPAESEGTEG